MKCPVCKTEYSLGISSCPNCGFSDLQRTFVSVADAEYWTNTVVREYRIMWMDSLKCFTFDRTHTELIKYTGTDAHVSVPYGVRVIRDAFYENTCIQSVDLPDTVEHLRRNAFNSCKNLTIVRIPNGLKTIGTTAFGYCSKLHISLPASVEEIAEEAFPQVQTIRIDPNNTRFKMLSGMLIDMKQEVLLAVIPSAPMMDIVVPEFVRRIGCQAFMLTKNIPRSIVLPHGLQSIVHTAGVNVAMKPVMIPNTVTKIEAGAFASTCKDIELEDGNPNYVKRNNTIIEKETRTLISVCDKSCKTVRISPEIRTIATRAFSFCENLTEIKLHGHIEEIGHCAFQSCSELDYIVIPKNVKEIGYDAFHGCDSLRGIYCEQSKQPAGWHTGWLASCKAKVYWDNEWKYVPQPIA